MSIKSLADLIANQQDATEAEYTLSGQKGAMEYPSIITEESNRFSLVCPVCDSSELDRDGGEFGNDHAAVTTHTDTDERLPNNPLQTRGGFTEIRYRCGNDHGLRLVLANNKGIEYIAMEVLS